MNFPITVKRSEFTNKLVLASDLIRLSAKVTGNDEAIVFIPLPGKMVEFANLLRDNDVTYETNGDLREEKPS